MSDIQILTKENLEKYKAELEELKVVTRKEIAQKIKEAREQGDLSENAEYDAAKDEQRDIEARIEELEHIIDSAQVLDESTIDYSKIHLGCKVCIEDVKSKKKLNLQIVDKSEVDNIRFKISYESPIGKALMNKELGDVVTVVAPNGTIDYKVIEIIKAEN